MFFKLSILCLNCCQCWLKFFLHGYWLFKCYASLLQWQNFTIFTASCTFIILHETKMRKITEFFCRKFGCHRKYCEFPLSFSTNSCGVMREKMLFEIYLLIYLLILRYTVYFKVLVRNNLFYF